MSPMKILASTVPIMLPFPPVISVPPKTTAVMIGNIVSLPISARAEPKYAVKKAPLIHLLTQKVCKQ